jgi:hypothetical protein
MLMSGAEMKKNIWFKRNRWLLGGLLLTCLALAIILSIWAAEAHQFQLALAHYNATYQPTIKVTFSPGGERYIPNPYLPPKDATGPGYWGWFGWIIRILALCVPISLGWFLHWREHYQFVRVHKTHLDHATNKLAEAIGQNQELPEGVFDAYSRLRDLEKRQPPV